MSRENNEADVAFIRALAELLREHELTELEVDREYGEDDRLSVRVARRPAEVAQPVQVSVPASAPASAPGPGPEAAAPATAAREEEPADPASHPGAVTSPMVGTAYLAPEPGAEPFVKVGDPVQEGQTLLIIEAMKTMNHIPAPRTGVVKRILVADASPVEYGTPLMIIE